MKTRSKSSHTEKAPTKAHDAAAAQRQDKVLCLRVPIDIAEKITHRVAQLNTRGQGRWSVNMVIVRTLQMAVARWESEAPDLDEHGRIAPDGTKLPF